MAMQTTTATTFYRLVLLTLALAAFTATTLLAQTTLTLSRHADFSTSDRQFAADDTLYLRAVAAGLDVTAIEASEFEIAPSGKGTKVSGALKNHLDGTFTAAIPAAKLQGTASAWQVRVKIEDKGGRTYDARTSFVLKGVIQTPQFSTVSGKVEAASATELTIKGTKVRLTGETRITIPGVTAPQPEKLIGLEVLALVQHTNDGLVALQVVAHPTKTTMPPEMELRGQLRHVAADSIVVNAVVFRVDGATKITDAEGRTVAVTSLKVGAHVRVQARRTTAGWLATEIKVEKEHRDEKNVLEGTLTAVGVGHIVVDSVRFVVNERTKVEGASNLAGLKAGLRVKVEFTTGPDGTHTAVKIEVKGRDDDDEDDEDREVEVEGLITALVDSTVSVNGLTFKITARTQIEGHRDQRLALSDLSVGLKVEVEGVYLADGSLVAKKIEVENGTEIEVRGLVTARVGNVVTIGTTVFTVTDSTKITGKSGAALTLGDVAVGMFAQAVLSAGPDGALTALVLKVEGKREREDVEVTGLIRTLTAAEITVGHLTFRLDAATQVHDKDGNEAGLGLLAQGMVVRVEGRLAADGTLTATQIRVRSNGHHEGEFRGPITALRGDTVVVADVTFRVSAHTIFKGVDGAAGLAVGQRVKVHYRLLADGTRLALRLKVEDDGERHVVLRGPITAVEGAVIAVAEARVTVTGQTAITDRDGKTLAAADLKTGMTILVHAVAKGDALEAVRIKVKEAVTVNAAVASRTAGTLTVAGQTFVLTEETLIVGANNAPRTLADIRTGVFVEVLAVSADDGAANAPMTADRVQVADHSVGTGVEPEDAGVPSRFSLHQNFPNPFNPTTTITFDLQDAGAQVSLVVYNVLGQAVRTLATGVHAAGQYSYTWDGQDARGQLVASGVYLYRLHVGDQVSTRVMTLLK